ncbi:unnamed protein product [Merluccius merluccius]
MDVLANHSIFQELQLVHGHRLLLRHAVPRGELAAETRPRGASRVKRTSALQRSGLVVRVGLPANHCMVI